jgi:hypothetical protein
MIFEIGQNKFIPRSADTDRIITLAKLEVESHVRHVRSVHQSH